MSDNITDENFDKIHEAIDTTTVSYTHLRANETPEQLV